MPARKFFYFFYGDLIPSGLPPGDDPRRFLSHRADGILSAVLEAGPSGLGYREACVRYSAGLVDGWAAGRDVLTTTVLGGLKTVCVRGGGTEDLPAGLERRRMGLQDYFISLMEEEDQR